MCSRTGPRFKLEAEDYGQIIINEIIVGALVHADTEEPSLLIWSENAAEQIGMAVKSIMKEERDNG
jgi:hypothetical protein